MRHWAGFDVGGQSVKAVVADPNGQVLAHGRRPTGPACDPAQLAEALRDLLATDLAAAAATEPRLGLGLAGVMGRDRILCGSPHLPKLCGHDVAAQLTQSLGRPVEADNDANCAALAEAWGGGAVEGAENFLLITLGTGLGSGLVLNGRVWQGANGHGCELGHSVLVRGGRRCGCGNLGCLEAYVSDTAAEKAAGEQDPAVAAAMQLLREAQGFGAAQALFALAADGGTGAGDLVGEMVDALGVGIASAINSFDVTTVVLGGGIAPAVLVHEDRLRRAVDGFLFGRGEDAVRIVGARHQALAGALGAARLAMLAG